MDEHVGTWQDIEDKAILASALLVPMSRSNTGQQFPFSFLFWSSLHLLPSPILHRHHDTTTYGC
jgi:hypothetical protein